MKSLILASAFLASSVLSAGECPDLRGTFQCPPGAVKVSITQSKDPQGADEYQVRFLETAAGDSPFQTNLIDANDQPRCVGTSETVGTGTEVDSCSNGILITQLTATMMNGLISEAHYALTEDGSLFLQQGLHSPGQAITNAAQVCQRIQ